MKLTRYWAFGLPKSHVTFDITLMFRSLGSFRIHALYVKIDLYLGWLITEYVRL